MSIGPTQKEDVIKTETIDKVTNTAKKIVSSYFDDPIYYCLFYSILILVLGTSFGIKFIIEFYVVILLLIIAKFVQYKKYYDRFF